MMALPFFSSGQQRPSLTKTAEAVESLEAENAAMRDRLMGVEEKLEGIVAKPDTVALTTLKPTEAVKVPVTADEVLALLTLIMSWLSFLFTGAISKKLPKWLTKFTLSLMVATVLSGVAFAFGKGQFSASEMFIVFGAVMGFSNAAHQTKKPLPSPAPATAG